MHHSRYIGKIGLMIGDKQHVFVRKLTYDFRAANMEVVKTIKSAARKEAQQANQPELNDQIMSKRVSL